jgi:hypothetical protein
MTQHEIAILRTVVYASLFEYPLTLDEVHAALMESELSQPEILRVYGASHALRRVVDYREGFFFPSGRRDLIAERRRRERDSRLFLSEHRALLRLVCTIPFTAVVALSGSVAHLNLEPEGDLDLFIITRGPHVWTVTVAVIVLAKLLRKRRTVCVNFVLADSHLELDQQDLFTANQVLHLKPLVGGRTFDEFVRANPFVGRFYPNGVRRRRAETVTIPVIGKTPRNFGRIKRFLELLFTIPSGTIEAGCRRLYRSHLTRRARLWRSPEQVQLETDCLKLHTHSHRHSILDRFDRAMEEALAACEVCDEAMKVG